MTSHKLSPGDQIESHCTKCRVVMNHTLVALIDDRPVRVKCNTCGGEHRYHAPREAKPRQPAKPAPAKKPARGKADPGEAARKEWEALQPQLETAQALAYAQDGSYPLHGVIRHPLFGLGQVQKVLGERKIEVLFKDGRKTLRCR